MPKVTFLASDGAKNVVEAAAGTSLMQAAMLGDVPGIVAECGGSMMCATCHVYVHEAWSDRIDGRDEVEEAMLESTAEPCRPNSRLSCQVILTEDVDGLIVETPRNQL